MTPKQQADTLIKQFIPIVEGKGYLSVYRGKVERARKCSIILAEAVITSHKAPQGANSIPATDIVIIDYWTEVINELRKYKTNDPQTSYNQPES